MNRYYGAVSIYAHKMFGEMVGSHSWCRDNVVMDVVGHHGDDGYAGAHAEVIPVVLDTDSLSLEQL